MKQLAAIVNFFLFLIGVVGAQSVEPIAARVEIYKGRAVVMLNNQPFYPALYALTDVPGGRWSWEELPSYNLRNFCSRGFKLIQVDLFMDHIWKEDGTISLDTTQKQLRGVLNVCPQAAIFIRLHVNPPKWWQRAHPEENTVYADTKPKPDYTWGVQRIIEDDEETPERFSLASQKWKTDVSRKLKEFLKKLQQLPEGNALAGIQIASGVYGEWHYWGFINNEPDMSSPMLNYFRSWLEKKYKNNRELQKAWNDASLNFASVSLPSLDERKHTEAGIFRDPQKERKVIDYYEAQHEVVAEDILQFCKLVKESWPRPIITGAFYGYFYAVFGREAAGGHLQLQKVLASADIDFLSGPGTYYPSAVEMGDPYRSRSLINSVLLHGKLWLDEMDQQAPLVPLKDSAFDSSVQKSIANVRRNVLFTFTKGAGLWFYDFGPSGFNGGKRLNDHGSWGWWDEPSLMEDIGRVKKLMDEKINTAFHSDADVLLVHDTKSFYYTGSAKDKSYMAHWVNNWIPVAVFKSGVVHDVIHVDDLEKIDPSAYKAIVFLNTWVLTEKQKNFINRKLATNNRHLFFVYAPGYADEKNIDTKFISATTGITVKKAGSDSVTVLLLAKEVPGKKAYTIWNNTVDPLFEVKDEKAVSLGTTPDGSQVLMARKNFPGYTSWYMALSPADASVWRYFFTAAGAHLYDDSEDIHYSGGDVLAIHSARGGERDLHLKNGTTLHLKLPPNSTTLLEATTGKILLQ